MFSLLEIKPLWMPIAFRWAAQFQTILGGQKFRDLPSNLGRDDASLRSGVAAAKALTTRAAEHMWMPAAGQDEYKSLWKRPFDCKGFVRVGL